jgi:NADH:ubiquinone oxidoreductase subunit D
MTPLETETEVMVSCTINFGPHHPATRGAALIVDPEGERSAT